MVTLQLQPNNRVIFYDKSYTPSKLKFPDFEVSSIEYSVERSEQKWTAGDDTKFFYELKIVKNENSNPQLFALVTLIIVSYIESTTK